MIPPMKFNKIFNLMSANRFIFRIPLVGALVIFVLSQAKADFSIDYYGAHVDCFISHIELPPIGGVYEMVVFENNVASGNFINPGTYSNYSIYSGQAFSSFDFSATAAIIDPVTGAILASHTQVITFTLGRADEIIHGDLSEPKIVDPSVIKYVSDPVDVVSGSFYQHDVDLEVSAPLPIQVVRNYSSSYLSKNEFGCGWLSGFNSYLIPSADESTIKAADMTGSIVVLRRVTGLDT